MERTKLLTISVTGLLLLNLATLGFLFLSGPKNHRPEQNDRPKTKEIIISKLHFDAIQQKEYEKIIKWHREAIRLLDDNIRETKNELYFQLTQPQVDVKTKDSLIAVLNSNQKQIEETHFKHFQDVKKLCHEEQLDNFNDLTQELSGIFARNKPPRPSHDD